MNHEEKLYIDIDVFDVHRRHVHNLHEDVNSKYVLLFITATRLNELNYII